MKELPAEVLRCQVDSLRDALVKVLETREKEAKAWFASHNAKENFSNCWVKKERQHLAAMTAASNAEKEARLLLATLKGCERSETPMREPNGPSQAASGSIHTARSDGAKE